MTVAWPAGAALALLFEKTLTPTPQMSEDDRDQRRLEETAVGAPTFDPVRFKETTREQWQEAAEAWDRWGPTLEDWLTPATDVMLDAAKVGAGARVLDVAAGAGGQTLAAARRVGPDGHVLATDLSPAILEYAAAAARNAGLDNVETREVDGESLAGIADESIDAVISRLGIIYFPDQLGALAEMRRVLRPGGRLAAIVWSTPEMGRFFSLAVGIIRRRAELPPPLPGQPGPFSLGGDGALAALFEQAGFSDVSVQAVASPLRMTSAAECLRLQQESYGALHQMLAGLDKAGRAAAWQEVGEALGELEGDDGFTAPCELLVGAATR